MNAVVMETFGGPEVLEPQTVADPKPGEGEVNVELAAAALNWHDCLVRMGQYPTIPLPHIPGGDGAGRRTDTGEPVLILPSLNWGADQRGPSAGFSILGDFTEGTYAELVTVPEENLRPIPSGWSMAEAAALPLAGVTAYRALFTRGALAAGETVLVLGAGGGVATIAVALARMAGARVLVTTSSPAKLEQAKSVGADGGALYTEPDWVQAIRAMTGDVGVDLVVDSVGSTWPDALSTLRVGGRLVAFGATGSSSTRVDVRQFYFGQWSILGTTMGSPTDFAGLLDLVASDQSWRPTVDRTYPLADARRAHADMAERRHVGKLVLEIA